MHEPKKTINTYWKPMVDELIELWARNLFLVFVQYVQHWPTLVMIYELHGKFVVFSPL